MRKVYFSFLFCETLGKTCTGRLQVEYRQVQPGPSGVRAQTGRLVQPLSVRRRDTPEADARVCRVLFEASCEHSSAKAADLRRVQCAPKRTVHDRVLDADFCGEQAYRTRPTRRGAVCRRGRHRAQRRTASTSAPPAAFSSSRRQRVQFIREQLDCCCGAQ